VIDRRKSELAQIHIAKQQLGLDEDTYRQMLWTVGRVTSARDLDHAGRKSVLDHMESRGWKRHAKPKVSDLKKSLVGKVEALLADMKLPWSYADGIARQMYKRDKLQWCNTSELRGIITALTNRQRGQKECKQ